MLFAEMDAASSFFLFVVIMALGLRQCAKWLGGNNPASTATRKGVASLLTRWMK
jgi:hypothetical protein